MRTRRYRKRGGEGEGPSVIDNAKSGITNFFGDFSKKAEEAKNSGLGFFEGLKKSASGLTGDQPPAAGVGGKRRKSKRKRTKKRARR